MRPVTKITVFGVRLGVVVLAVYWSAIYIGTHLPLKMDPSRDLNLSDKSKHFFAYVVLGWMLCYVTTSDRLLRRFALIAVIGMVYAALDEWTQGFVPGRVPDFYDFVADTAGLWFAIGTYVLAKSVHRALGSPKTRSV